MSGVTCSSTSQTKEYWAQQYSDNFDDVSREATWRISSVFAAIGGHNYKARVLDLYCGLGAMVEKMSDGGFHSIYGVDDAETLSDYWFHKERLSVMDPLDTDYNDDSFELVTCYGGFDRTDRHDDLLNEMRRLTSSLIVFRPYDQRGFEHQKKALPLLMEHRLDMVKFNPVHGYITLRKEVCDG